MVSARPRVSVLLSTYNNPRALALSLLAWARQSVLPDELIVLDDGSEEETAAVIARFTRILPLVHVWQPHRGFRKPRLLNHGARVARFPYLVFSDGDCLPREDFLATHLDLARPGAFVSGGSYVNLPATAHREFSDFEVIAGDVFDRLWLFERGVRGLSRWRFLPRGPLASLLDCLTARRLAFVGNNSACWREDLLAIGGFDEHFGYGGADRDAGYRLANQGLRCLYRKFSLVVLHLDHPRDYRDPAQIARQKQLAAAHRRERVSWLATSLAHNAESLLGTADRPTTRWCSAPLARPTEVVA